jgi:1,4-alpha-glucan branching enzyme
VIRRSIDKRTGQVKLTFAIPSDAHPGAVSVVGDFNGWTPGVHTLVKRANGMRSVAISVPTGTQSRFRYKGECGHWFDDHDADAVDHQGGVLRV